MSLALQAITRHEGLMHVESAGGRGTMVMIWLPARPRTLPREELETALVELAAAA